MKNIINWLKSPINWFTSEKRWWNKHPFDNGDFQTTETMYNE